MAAGVAIKHKRKAGAFANGELAAGEMGLDTTGGVWYFSTNSTTVVALTVANLGGLSNTTAEALLSSTTVNTNVGTKQSLYTVPTGKKAVVTKIIARSSSADLTGMLGSLTFGFDGSALDFGAVFGGNHLALLLDATTAILLSNDVNLIGLAGVIGNASNVFGCIFNDTSITATLKIDVFGYLF
jgi:hypothetical protein